MNKDKYVGMDVHQATTVIEVLNGAGKTVNQTIIETKAGSIRDFFRGLSGTLHVTFEEGTQAAWLYELIKPFVAELIVCDARHNKLITAGNKGDKVDCHKLAELLRLGSLKAVYHGDAGTRKLKELVRIYDTLMSDCIRVMNRIKALYRSRGVKTSGTQVFLITMRHQWIIKISDDAFRARLAMLYQELDCLSPLRKEARKNMVAEVRRHPAYKILKQVPSLGPVRVAQIIAVVVSPHRFRTKRQFWPYCGLGVVTVSSADYKSVNGRICRVKKPIGTRGLNRNYNRHLKAVFKGAAQYASARGPFKPYYDGLIAKKMRKEMAKLTLARKISAITLAVWKSGEKFDPERLKEEGAA
jgi:transposase